MARRETYTGEDLHDTLVDFRSTQIDKMGTVKSPDADDIVNTLVGSYDTELRSKLVGFGDLQDARKAAFDLTNTIKKDFSIKPRKDASGFVLAPDQRINMGSASHALCHGKHLLRYGNDVRAGARGPGIRSARRDHREYDAGKPACRRSFYACRRGNAGRGGPVREEVYGAGKTISERGT